LCKRRRRMHGSGLECYCGENHLIHSVPARRWVSLLVDCTAGHVFSRATNVFAPAATNLETCKQAPVFR
jgi:hypothetical protein